MGGVEKKPAATVTRFEAQKIGALEKAGGRKSDRPEEALRSAGSVEPAPPVAANRGDKTASGTRH